MIWLQPFVAFPGFWIMVQTKQMILKILNYN